MAAESKAMALIVAELRRRRCHPVRIEDKSSTGTPDLNFHSKYSSQDVWIELKDANKETSGLYSVKIRPAQFAWYVESQLAGRRVFLVIRIERRWLVILNKDGWRHVMKRFEYFHYRIWHWLKLPMAIEFKSVEELIDYIS